MKMMTKVIAAAAIAASAGVVAHAGGHGGNPAVKARVSLMNVYAHYLGTLGAMAKGEMEYDAAKADGAAKSLAALSRLDQSAMWPQGTSTDELGAETRALPVIWTSYPAITEKGKAFGAAAAAMAEAAGTDLASLRGAIGAVGQSCGGCHKEYRQPKE